MRDESDRGLELTETSDNGRMTIHWRDFALVSLAVAFGAVTALVIVVAVGEPGALETTALVLAIVAFGVQFAAYATASSDASRQLQQSMTIYAETREALATIRQTTTMTQDTLLVQNMSLIQTLLSEMREGAEKAEQQSTAAPDTAAMASQGALLSQIEALSDRVSELAGTPTLAATSPTRQRRPTGSARGNERAIEALETWPPREDLEAALETIAELPDETFDSLGVGAAVELRRRREGSTDLIAVWHRDTDEDATIGPHELLERGLAKTVPTPTRYKPFEEPGEHWISFTPEGRKLARVLTATGEPPAPLPERVEEMRKFVRDYMDVPDRGMAE